MNRQKKFDCVEMKREVQEKVRQKYAGIPEGEAHRLQREAVLGDPVLGPFLSKLRSRRSPRRAELTRPK
jgi:hypothetical protein